jgi:hypothetical protein
MLILFTINLVKLESVWLTRIPWLHLLLNWGSSRYRSILTITALIRTSQPSDLMSPPAPSPSPSFASREETSPCTGCPRQAAAVLASGGWALPNTGKTVPTYSGHLLRRGVTQTQTLLLLGISQSGGSDKSRGRTWASRLTATPACARGGWSGTRLTSRLVIHRGQVAPCKRLITHLLPVIVAIAHVQICSSWVILYLQLEMVICLDCCLNDVLAQVNSHVHVVYE